MFRKKKSKIKYRSWRYKNQVAKITVGEMNTISVLPEMVNEYLLFILISAEMSTNFMFDILEKDSEIEKRFKDDDWFSIFIDFLCLYFHFTDRSALKILSAKERTVMMKKLMNTCFKSIVSAINREDSITEQNKIKSKYIAKCKRDMLKYTKYKHIISDNTLGEDSVLMVFGKKIAEFIGCKDDIKYILSCTKIINICLNRLDIEDNVEGMSYELFEDKAEQFMNPKNKK